MAKKRVHEIAKSQGMTSKEVLAKLQAAGLEVKAAASSVEESDALKALGGRNGAAPAAGWRQRPSPPRAPSARRRKARCSRRHGAAAGPWRGSRASGAAGLV